MKFKLLLLILGQKLKKAARSTPAFKEFIKGKNVKILMKTADGKQGRAFILRDGTINASSADFSNAVSIMLLLGLSLANVADIGRRFRY